MPKELNEKSIEKASTEFNNSVAEAFGTKRITLLEKRVKSIMADVEHSHLFIQCKRRKNISIYNWYDSAVEEAPSGKLPIIVIRANHKRSLVVIDLDDYVSVYDQGNNVVGEELASENKLLVEENKRLRALFRKFDNIETVEERRQRIHTYPYKPYKHSPDRIGGKGKDSGEKPEA